MTTSSYTKPKGVTMGQIQWLLFWASIADSRLFGVWLISVIFFEDKELA